MQRTHALIANSPWSLGCLLVLLLAVPAAAAPSQVAGVENLGTKLVFYPEVDDEVVLRVTGPCNFEYRELIKSGDVGVFALSEETIDAAYSFELVVRPKVDGSILEVYQQARKHNDYTEVNALCREGALPGAPLTQASGFLVSQGKIIYDPKAIEDPRGYSDVPEKVGSSELPERAGGSNPLDIPFKDFVINDDLIVDGSACIGFDCVNGESFSFDTIRLKENNLRIKFDDTSVAASFPRTDWQLTANASANGGASKFSIDDISGNRTPFTVEANARSHSLYVDDGGRIGNRTSTPSTEIHTIDGDTPTLRLQQDGSSGFAPQTWDVAGNETNFFIRDVSNGSTLPFRIRPGAPTSAIFIDVDGSVGFGTASPDEELHIQAPTGGNAALLLDADTVGGVEWLIRSQSNGQMQWRDDTGGTIPLRVAAGADTDLLQIGVSASDAVDIDGNLNITGTCVGCDAVFQPEFPLESIEEHAASMWENSYLPAVGATPEGQTSIDVFKKTTGILQELEKAHIYIEQLHERLGRLEAALEAQAAE